MDKKSLTIPVNVDQMVEGYVVNAPLGEEAQRSITSLQNMLVQKFPNTIWVAPKESLHITLMDWLTPVVSYKKHKDALFQEIERSYKDALASILDRQPPIRITFNKIEVYPSAIILRGYDDGSYQQIRSQFMQKIQLLPGTKQPPGIIHTTVCRFNKKTTLNKIISAVENKVVEFSEETHEFRLVRESQVFMLEYETLSTFKLC